MFKLNQSYLIKEDSSYNSTIVKVRILEVTQTCYRVEWQYANVYSKYLLKENFEKNWKIIEDLGI